MNPDGIRKILVVGAPRIGDVAMSLHVFANLKNCFPHSLLTVLTLPYPAAIYQVDPHIDSVLFDSGSFLSVLKKIRIGHYDLIIDLTCDHTMRYALMAKMSKANFTVGYNYFGRGLCFDKHLQMPDLSKHITEIFSDLLRAMNVPILSSVPVLKVPDEILHECREMLKKAKINSTHRIFAIHPGAHHPTQCWPLRRYIELAKSLGDVQGAKVLFFADMIPGGTSTDADSLADEENILVIKQISVMQLIGLLSLSDLLVCNNSGPLNLAVALGLQTVSIMGPTNRNVWCPIDSRHSVIVNESLDCLGCNKAQCIRQDHACMSGIDTQMVLEVIQNKIMREEITA